jgi:hypothetical protein
MRTRGHGKLNGFTVVLVCLALLALLTVVQVAHVHSIGTDTDHCPLCVVLHSAAPVVAAAALIVLVQITLPAPELETHAARGVWHRQLFSRPPPSMCQALLRHSVSA